MLNLIFLIVFLVSLLGMVLIIWRKVPVLVELSPQEIQSRGVLRKIKSKVRIKNKNFFKFFFNEAILQKILCKFRILILKTENKTTACLNRLRQKTPKEKKDFLDDYWKNIKKKLP